MLIHNTALTMRGKSPNWLLGVLYPTTYILGGEYRFCVTKEDEDEWLVSKYSGKGEMYCEPLGKVTEINNCFYYTRRLGLTAELKFLEHPCLLLGLLNNEIHDLSFVKVYKHTRCKYCRTWVRAVSSILREAGPCCYRRNS